MSHPSDAREAEIREWFHTQQQLGLKAPLASIIGDLIAINDAQRRLCAEAATALEATNELLKRHAQLPVIQTCGDCRWLSLVGRDCICTHLGQSVLTKQDEAPPTWCPWRGPR